MLLKALSSLIDCMASLFWKITEVNMMEDIGLISVYGITKDQKRFSVSLRIEEEKDA